MTRSITIGKSKKIGCVRTFAPWILNDMHNIRSIFFVSLLIGNVFGHNSENDHHPYDSFEDRIHGMCRGHYQLGDDELKEICNHFSEHYSDILEIQSKPPESSPERFINNLTVLVILSDTLTKEQKHNFYRRSYDQALEAQKHGDEWKWLLGLLVERTDSLSLSELEDLMKNTKHESMKPFIEKAMDRQQRISKNGIRASGQELNKRVGLRSEVEEEQSSADKEDNRIPWIVVGSVLTGMLLLLGKFMRGRAAR